MSIFLANGDANQNSQGTSPSLIPPPSPLSSEATGLRASLTTQQALLDTVEAELSSMEQTDLKKLRLYKIALVILTVIGLAILFVIPVAMIFNVSLWIPVVITLGVAVFSGAISGKLRSCCQEIRLKYRSLQVYRRHLYSKHPDLRSSTLSKYRIEFPKNKSLKDKMLAKLRPDVHQHTYDGGAAIDKSLGLSGDLNSRYQCEALIGIDSVQDSVWQKRLEEVLKAKVELLKSTPAYETLRTISNSALQETGVDLPALLPGMDFIDLAKSLMSICAFGNKVGLEIRQSIDQYERTYLHSKTLTSLLCEVSPSTRLYLSKERQTVDITLDMFAKLQMHINRVQLVDWLEKFADWKTDVYSLIENPTLLGFHQKIIASANKLNIHEGINSSRQTLVRNVLMQIESIITEYRAGNCDRVDRIKASLQESLEKEFKNICKSLGDKRAHPADLSDKVQKEFIGYLSSLGNLCPLFDKIHKCIQLGNFVRADLEKAIQRHPDNQRVRILSSIDQLLSLVNKDDWGAVSTKSVEEILGEKNAIIQELGKIRQKVEHWSEKYNDFKSQKMTRILMSDFSENYSAVESAIGKLWKTHHRACDVETFIVDCRTFLNSTYTSLKDSLSLPTKEEVAEWSGEFKTLLSELESVIPEIQAAGQRIQSEGITGSAILKQAITSKESSLKIEAKKKEAELIAAIRGKRSETEQNINILLDEGIDYMQSILSRMGELEQSLNDPNNITVEEIIRASNQLFSVMHDPRSSKLADLEEILSARGEGGVATAVTELGEITDSTTQTVSDAQQVCKGFWETRNKDLDGFLKQVQKIAQKWNLGQSIVLFVLGLIFLIVSLSLLSLQMVWIPVGLSAAVLFMQLVPMFFNRVIEKKTFDVRAAALAKDLLPATKILSSEFDNPNLQRLSQIQDILQLEGYEQSWAKELIRDLDGSPTDKKEDFKRTVNELKNASKSLDKNIRKRFGTNNLQDLIDRKKSAEKISTVNPTKSSSSQAVSVVDKVSTTPLVSAREVSTSARQRRLDELVVGIAQIEEEENKIVAYRLRYDNEVLRYQQQKAYRKQLQQQFNEVKTQFPGLEKEIVESQGMADILSQAISQLPDSQADSKEMLEKTEILTQLIFKIHDPQLSREDIKEAKQIFDGLVKEVANAGTLQDLQEVLELSACLGSNNVRLDQIRREQLSRLQQARAASLPEEDTRDQLNRVSQRAVIGEQELEVRKRALDFLGVGYVSPFLEFSFSSVPGKGNSQAQDALKELRLLKLKITSSGEVSSEEYRKAKRLLSSYLELEKQLSPLAYGTLLGDENFVKSTQIMREKQSLQEIVEINTTLGLHNLCSLATQRISNWIAKRASKRDNERIISSLLESIRVCESSGSQNQEKLQELYNKLLKLPKYILLYFAREFKVKALMATQKMQTAKEIQKRLATVSSVVEEKDKMFAQSRASWEGELHNLSQMLQNLQIRKHQLVQEKIALRNRLFSDDEIKN
ncbi:myosin heavy chain major plasmodial [Chlamydia felis Fe/C-56]|uniref:Myosin heavy chain major plasmodial n=1 Tax=Chlamydia felis (strain Fe/C-56) TaxID=264202 RepID=Q254X8_CHLFF|nr:hypothetical protein [Chlamydia felis]BAE81160.1 myosin heavy chain major plasmodial [Chlamydia felis Fe/C-56]